MFNVSNSARKGWTLIELMVVIAITALLIGLLLMSIQAARNAVAVTQSMNNLKQICLGLQGFASDHRGRLPATMSGRRLGGTWLELLPYIEQMATYRKIKSSKVPDEDFALQVSLFLNPLDPSNGVSNPNLNYWQINPSQFAISSYGLNSQFFAEEPRLQGMTDGASQTIWLAEHYGWNCGGTAFTWTIEASSSWQGLQPANFAMVFNRPLPHDYYPITSGQPPVSTAGDATTTFQVAPSLSDCNPRLPNASTPRGLQTGWGDGSVRILAPSTSPQVFWGLVTPAGGEPIAVPD